MSPEQTLGLAFLLVAIILSAYVLRRHERAIQRERDAWAYQDHQQRERLAIYAKFQAEGPRTALKYQAAQFARRRHD